MNPGKDALYVLARLIQDFPGIVTDDDVNGADLAMEISYHIHEEDGLRDYLLTALKQKSLWGFIRNGDKPNLPELRA